MSLEETERTDTDTEEKAMRKQRQGLEGCSHKPRGAWISQKLTVEKDCPPGPPEGVWTCNTSISDFWPPELRGNKFLLFCITCSVVLIKVALRN